MTSLAVERVPVSALTEYPGNARRGDVTMIMESLREHGQYRPIVAQRSTGHILAGNHTWKAAAGLGWAEIDVVYLDVDDVAAKRVLLMDNRSNDVASYSMDDLASLLVSLDGNLAGTGYTLADLARLSPELPEGFAVLDPDAAGKPKMVTCPSCGHQFTP